MSITTERPGALTSLAAVGRNTDGRNAEGRSTGGRDTLDRTRRSYSSVRTSRPRTSCASLDRRRYLHALAQQHRGNRVIDRSFDDEAPRQTMSWTATIAGVLITAIVLLSLVGLANLRAGYLDGGSAGAVTSVEQGGFEGQDLITATDPGQ